jgi:hypothetical protein
MRSIKPSKNLLLSLFTIVISVSLSLLANPRFADAAAAALTKVFHDSTLTGDGTSASPLKIAKGGVGPNKLADGAVTAQKIDAGTPSAGQVLTFNGTGLAWGAAGGGGLSAVSHDATLTGNGTAGTPLGLNDGAVTAQKINTGAEAQSGQVLGFDGSALEWQTPGGLRVVDSIGNEVGVYFLLTDLTTFSQDNLALRHLDGVNKLLKLKVNPDGFQNNTVGLYLTYETTDCTGPARLNNLFQSANDFFTNTLISDGQIYYATGPSTASSQSIKYPDQTCHESTGANSTPYATIPVADLGLTPPFKVVR